MKQVIYLYTLKTGMLVEKGDSMLKLLQIVSHSEIKFGVPFNKNRPSQIPWITTI